MNQKYRIKNKYLGLLWGSLNTNNNRRKGLSPQRHLNVNDQQQTKDGEESRGEEGALLAEWRWPYKRRRRIPGLILMAIVGCTGTSPENTAASLYRIGGDPVEGNPGPPRSSGARTLRRALFQDYEVRSSRPRGIGVGIVLLGGRRKSDDLKPGHIAMLATFQATESSAGVNILCVPPRLDHVGSPWHTGTPAKRWFTT